jgi:uncharacterized protein (DUF1800 family)
MLSQNQTFRRNATGNFGTLLEAIIRDPAMLAYLNNNASRKQKPNENLAREIMELFALGIGSYSEQDIKEGARALTGYSFDDDEFVFREKDHDQNPKTILGTTGRLKGEDFVKVILAQPACAQFIARKLYHFFVADLPPLEATDNDRALDEGTRGVIRDLASTLRSSRYELRPLLKRMFMSEHFYDARVRGQHIKSPVELVVGAVRSLGTPTRDLSLLIDAMDLMGQDLFYPPSVKGWDGGRAWINTSTLFVRQNILAYLLTGKRPKGKDPLADSQKFDGTALLADLAKAEPGAEKDPRKVAGYLLPFAIGSAPTDAAESLVGLANKAGGTVTPDVVTAMLLLITAMPEYQLC